MKTNETIVVIPNGEAYGRVFTTTYLSEQAPGSVLLAIIMAEQVKRHEQKAYNQATGTYVVTEPEVLHTVPTYIFGVKHDACLTEQEAALTELRAEHAATREEGRKMRQELRDLEEVKDKLSTQNKQLGERIGQQEAALQVAAGAQQKLLTANRKMEETLGKVRMHFGTEAFDKATGGGK